MFLSGFDDITSTPGGYLNSIWFATGQFDARVENNQLSATPYDWFCLAGRNGKYVPSGTSRPLNDWNVSWMHDNLDLLGGRPLRRLCMPSSHDAGMGSIDDRGLFGPAIRDTTQTQTLTIREQLLFGVRCFDIRPFLLNGRWMVGHFSDEIPAGAVGESLETVIQCINDYSKRYHELIILNISHVQKFVEPDWANSPFVRGMLEVPGEDKKLTLAVNAGSDEWRSVLHTLAYLDNLCPRSLLNSAPDKDLTKLKLNDFIGGTKPSARVIVRIGDDIKGYDFVRDGLNFFTNSEFPLFDEYANSTNPDQVFLDQRGKLQRERKTADDEMFVLNWTITQNPDAAVNATIRHFTPPGVLDGILKAVNRDPSQTGDTSILSCAEKFNKRLGRQLIPDCSKDSYPNFINIDRVDTCDALVVSHAINFMYGH